MKGLRKKKNSDSEGGIRQRASGAKETVTSAASSGAGIGQKVKETAAISVAEWTRIYAAILFVYVILGATGIAPFPSIGSEAKIAIVCFLGVPIVLWPLLKKFVTWLQDITKVRVHRINPEKEQLIRTWEAGITKAQELENVRERGEAYKWLDSKGVTHYAVEYFDPKTSEYKGSWMGEASDVELFTEREQIKKNRGRYRFYSQIGFDLLLNFESIVHSVEQNIKAKVMGKEAQFTAKEPSALIEEIAEGIESMDEDDIKAALNAEEKDPRNITQDITGAELLEQINEATASTVDTQDLQQGHNPNNPQNGGESQ